MKNWTDLWIDSIDGRSRIVSVRTYSSGDIDLEVDEEDATNTVHLTKQEKVALKRFLDAETEA